MARKIAVDSDKIVDRPGFLKPQSRWIAKAKGLRDSVPLLFFSHDPRVTSGANFPGCLGPTNPGALGRANFWRRWP
jgi:hypothetical protein